MEDIRVLREEEDNDVFAIDETEDEVVETVEEETVSEKGVLTLRKPFSMDGRMIKSLDYDFTRLTPQTYTEIVKKVGRKETVTIPSLNLSVQANMFCRAAGIPAAVIKNQMSVPDFEAACGLARDFLLSNSATEEDLI